MYRRILQAGLTLALLLLVSNGSGQAPSSTERGLPVMNRVLESAQARVIVRYKTDGALMRSAAAGRARHGHPFHAAALSHRLGLRITDGRMLGTHTQSLRAAGLSSARLAAQLAADPDVEWAVPDQRRFVRALTNDPFLTDNQASITPTVGQWYLRAPVATAVSAINAVGAWDRTSGSPLVTIAVIDTGVRSHPELATKLHPGYDFIHDDTVAHDGGGRDTDASDPGDFETSSDCGNGVASDSSWHGTQVAGLIGARSDDGIGMASVGRDVMILPVRVLGRCGGFDSDIIAAMRWAGGLTSEVGFGVSVNFPNLHPAQVINLSLGSPGSCPASYRDAIAELNQVGVTVVVAAGNENGLAVNTPANCAGAIAVSGLRHIGTKVGYSSVGPQVAIAAPAGNCINEDPALPCLYPLLSTTNSGTTVALADSYSDSDHPSLGTSFAAPLVAGTVGLMLSVNPAMTPAQVRVALQSSATSFVSSGAVPSVTSCRAPDFFTQIECYCTTSTCGAGMLNAALAVVHALNPFVVVGASNSTPLVGSAVNLNGSASSAQGGRSISTYQWSITSGAALAHFNGPTNGATASLQVLAAGSIVVQLSVTDNTGAVGLGSVSLEAQAAAGSGSGGGAIDLGSLIGLIAVVPGVLLVGRRTRR